MTRVYNYGDTTQITEHFKASEFQCKCGNAADICCIGQDGQPISSKLVCCAAQDIGFTGIANINYSYTYTHVDVRPGSKWYGNEIHGNDTYKGTLKKE